MTPIGKVYDELNEYLDDKIPDVSVSVRREIAVHIAGLILLREKDVVEETVEMMRNSMKGSTKMSRRELMERSELLTEARREKLKG